MAAGFLQRHAGKLLRYVGKLARDCCCNPCGWCSSYSLSTPAKLTVSISGIVLCPCGPTVTGTWSSHTASSLSGTFDVPQTAGNACIYELVVDVGIVNNFYSDAGCTTLTVYHNRLLIHIEIGNSMYSSYVGFTGGTVTGNSTVWQPTTGVTCQAVHDGTTYNNRFSACPGLYGEMGHGGTVAISIP